MLLDQKNTCSLDTPKKIHEKVAVRGGGGPNLTVSLTEKYPFFDDFLKEGREKQQFAYSNKSDYQNSCLISSSSSKMKPLFLYV